MVVTRWQLLSMALCIELLLGKQIKINFFILLWCFDLREEVFREIGLPKVSNNNIDGNRVCVFNYFSILEFPCPVL